jgi:hypothetical protein
VHAYGNCLSLDQTAGAADYLDSSAAEQSNCSGLSSPIFLLTKKNKTLSLEQKTHLEDFETIFFLNDKLLLVGFYTK